MKFLGKTGAFHTAQYSSNSAPSHGVGIAGLSGTCDGGVTQFGLAIAPGRNGQRNYLLLSTKCYKVISC
eukprot:959027-Pelagomonas_calceolata.AAC.2